MKNKQVKFVCDKCGKETGFNNELKRDMPSFKSGHPYEYQNGWVYLHKIELKLFKIGINLDDKHFCCKECFIEFLKNEIDTRLKILIVDKLK